MKPMPANHPLPSNEPWPHAILGVALDMDGLMLNTEELYTEISSIILARRNHTFDFDLKMAMMGKPAIHAWQIMIERLQLQDDWEQLQAEADALFEELLPEKIAPMPGLHPLLDHIDACQLPKCVATSSRRSFAQRALGLCQLDCRVDFILTSEDVQKGKPAPDIYWLAASRMNIPVQQMMVLEDSVHGAHAGVAAGACVVAVPDPALEPHRLPRVWSICQRVDDTNVLRQLQGRAR